MKRPRAELDPHPSSPTPKRSRRAVQCASYPEGQMSASQTSTDSSTSTLLNSPPEVPPEYDVPSSDLDDSISDTSSSTSSSTSPSILAYLASTSTSSTSGSLNDSSSTNTNSSSSSSNPFYLTRPPLTDADLAREIATYNAINDFTTNSNTTSLTSTSASISDDISPSPSPSSSTNSASALDPSSPSFLSFTPSASTASLSSPSSNASSSSSSEASHTGPHHPVFSTENLVTLQSRLCELLPKMRSANQELEVERAEGRLGERDIENLDEEGEEGEEGKGYIEMDLGLGVLEERGEGRGGGKESEWSRDSDGEEDDGANNRAEIGIGRLLNLRKTKRRKVKIEEVGG